MSLVAYASSDEDSLSEKEEEASVLPSLPKKREPVKISIPSLKEFVEEDKTDVPVKPKPKGGSGLFSILPPPKNSSTFSKPGFTPYVFSKKKESKVGSQIKKQTSHAFLNEDKNAKTNNENSVTEELNDSSEKADADDFNVDSSERTDYFSLNTKSSPPENTINKCEIEVNGSLPLTSRSDSIASQESSAEMHGISNYSLNNNISSTSGIENYAFIETSVPEAGSSSINWGSLEMRNVSSLPESEEPPDFLKDKEFLKLKGRKELENVNIIDVSADDQLTGKDQWIMQSLTQETYRPLKRKHDMPTSQQKRKHQITYLAFQAKERELDLKNQWALNNRTRRETQAKYGF